MRSLPEILTQKVLKNYCGLRQWLSLKLNDFRDSQAAAVLQNFRLFTGLVRCFRFTAISSKMNAVLLLS